MRRAAVSQFKARLSDYLNHVKSGEEVIITESGKAIARVVPSTGSGPTPTEREEMIRAGLLIPAKRKALPPDFWDRPRAKLKDPNDSLVQAVLDEREEGY